ncbi:MAG: sulfurtransferase TusA family protein [Chromatiales bacterium]|nr:sulfurtransferase TusA family protein [Chromatiales bacterium]
MTRLAVDARRLLCPLPVIRLQDQVAQLRHGDQVIIIATDPGVKLDIPAWCRVHGHSASLLDETDGEIRFLVTVEAAPNPPKPT